jgi:RNA polymerase sigma-70 factor (ECF subfamily)
MTASARAEPERLLDRCRTGDAAALGDLLERYRPYLTLLARLQVGRRLQGKADPADLVQETFLEAHRQFHRFAGTSEGEWVCWLRQILATRLAMLVRSFLGTRRRDVRLEHDLARALDHSSQCLDQALAARSGSPSHQAASREQAVLLAQALERLPPDYRDVIVWRHLEGMTFPEVARQMGRSLDSVKNLWARALARLRGLAKGLDA